MLTSSVPLLAADELLPARDQHLDPVWAAARLTELLGETVEPVRRVRAKYRIGESLRVVHAVRIGGTPATMTARLFHGGASASAASRSAGTQSDAIHDVVHDSVWWRFPNDRKMPGLADVMTPTPELSASLGLAGWVRSEVAEYAPERSLTVRADASDAQVLGYVKQFAPGSVDTARIAARYAAAAAVFAPAPRLAVPDVLGRTDTLLSLSPMPGTAWTAAEHDGGDVLAQLGEAIARFHTIPSVGLAGGFGRLTTGRLVRSAELVGVARPELVERLKPLIEMLAEGPPPGSDHVLLHGDCHPKNSLVADQRLALIDLDQAGVGSPACDIASLLARLAHGVVLGEHTAPEADRLGAAFLSGYAAIRALPDPVELRWHVVAALVAERAIRAVNRVHPAALRDLAALVDTALDIAFGTAFGTAFGAAFGVTGPSPTFGARR